MSCTTFLFLDNSKVFWLSQKNGSSGICNFAPQNCVNVFHVYRPTVFSGSRACSATLFAVSLWKRACSRTENYGKECKAKGFLKMLLGVFIVFVKAHLNILSLHIPDEPYYRPPLAPPLKRGGPVCPPLEGPMISNGTEENLWKSAESVGNK